MAEERVERKLAAILAAGENETGTGAFFQFLDCSAKLPSIHQIRSRLLVR